MADVPSPLGAPSAIDQALGARAGRVYLVGAGPGDPELLTRRAAALLASADVVLHDQLVDPATVALARADAHVACVGKRGSDPGKKQLRQDAIVAELLAHARAGRSVVRLKGGDPFLFGRGSEEAQALREAGVPFEVVPGIMSPAGATAYAGIPLTHREAASSVTFVTAVQRDGAAFDWAEVRGLRGTLCVFMGLYRLPQVCRGLIIDAHRSATTPAALVEWISHPRQRTVTGTLADIAERAVEQGVASPALLVVGEVVALRDTVRWFDRQPLFGKRVLVTRPPHQLGPTASLLRQRGADVVPFPTIAIQPPPDPGAVRDAVARLAGYDLVVFTSDNGVRWLWRALDEAGLDARAFGRARVAAIGPATRDTLAAHGLRADIVARGGFVAEALAETILEAVAPAEGKRALLARALVAREVLPERLRAAGMQVDVVPVYETVAATHDRRDELVALLAGGHVDAVTLTSSSTVTELCALLGDDAATLLGSVTLASIGPITTATAVELGLRVAVTAPHHTSVGLVDAMEAFYAAGP